MQYQSQDYVCDGKLQVRKWQVQSGDGEIGDGDRISRELHIIDASETFIIPIIGVSYYEDTAHVRHGTTVCCTTTYSS